jgi:hypothetical protein
MTRRAEMKLAFIRLNSVNPFPEFGQGISRVPRSPGSPRRSVRRTNLSAPPGHRWGRHSTYKGDAFTNDLSQRQQETTSYWSTPLHTLSVSCGIAGIESDPNASLLRETLPNCQANCSTVLDSQRFRSGSPTNNRETDPLTNKKDRTIRLISVRA